MSKVIGALVAVCVALPPAAFGADRAIVSAAYFYWYGWDRATETGSWVGGVYNTPLEGYYDSATYEDNLRSLRTAADWGITDCFMDYWGYGWKDRDGNPRELLLTRAAEQLERDGFNLHMSVYQDAEDFAMHDFAANLAPGRHAEWWLRTLAPSPAWLRLRGSPFGVIYARNGVPTPTTDAAAFRAFLRQRYGGVEGVNRAWGTPYASLDEIEMGAGTGLARADEVDFVYSDWTERWQEFQRRARDACGMPGVGLSFDVGFEPFRGMGFTNFVSLFGGPHSYAGVAVPHDQDQERFLYHMAARYADREAFDHHKCYYHDWEIRTPGASWQANPYRFDRSFANMLTRYACSTLHMSWNEWWEGSNLEPTTEFGKGPCETNLFYSTVMQECFDALKHPGRGARVAYIVNEWPYAVGSPTSREVLQVLARLRALGLCFEAIPAAYLSQVDLSQYDLLIAPGCGVGFGRDGTVAARLVEAARKGKTLLTSRAPDMLAALGVRPAPPGSASSGPMNAFFDIGVPGDEECIIGGASFPENWGAAPPGADGPPGRAFTCRWTPGDGRTLSLSLPLAPDRGNVLRLAGTAVFESQGRVALDGKPVGEISVRPGWRVYELPIPRATVGSAVRGVVTVTFVPPRIPKEADPVRYPSEARTCNLALDWVQMASAEFPSGHRTRVPEPAPARTRWVDALGQPLAGSALRSGAISDPIEPTGRPLTVYAGTDTPRDLWIPVGRGHVGYVNGSLSDVDSPDYLRAWIEGVAGVPINAEVAGADCAGVALAMGDTTVLPVYNYTVGADREVRFRVPTDGLPVASVTALRRDGHEGVPFRYSVADGSVSFSDDLAYYGLYQVVRAPVGVTLPLLETAPGCTTEVDLPLRNLTDRPQFVTAQVSAVTPTVWGRAPSGEPAKPVAIDPRGDAVVRLALLAREDADWGRKTAVLRLAGEGWESKQIVTVIVRPQPAIAVTTPVIHASSPTLSLRSLPNRYLAPPQVDGLQVAARDHEFALGDLAPGQTAEVRLPEGIGDGLPRDGCFAEVPLLVSYRFMGRPAEQTLHVRIAYADHPTVPPTAFGKVVSLNPSAVPLATHYVRCPVDLAGRDPGDVSVRTAAADAVPSIIERTSDGPVLHAITNIPVKWNRCLFLCDGGDRGPATDLEVSADDLGTGRGVLHVANGHYAITLSERAGGCATELRSRATGVDYAAGTFGASAGRFKQLPPGGTAIGDGTTIRDDMTRQRESTGLIRVVLGASGGPLVRVIVEGTAGYGIAARQEYTFVAGQPWFLLTATASGFGPAAPDEVCALDFRVERRGLTKIFPNWTGIVEGFAQSHPHCGWRESVDVPELVTLLESPTPQNREAWSLGVLDKRGLDRLRVGWWPAKRPQPGRCRYGEVEFVADGARLTEGPVSVTCAVMLHSGHHVAGRELLADVRGRAPATFYLLPPRNE